MKTTTTGLNIKAVSERTGVPLHTLRAWERRYGVPRPGRIPGNRYRVYDERDIADVLWMKRQVEAGVSPAQASALLQQQGLRVPAGETRAEQPIAQAQTALLNALMASDEAGAQKLLDEAWALYSPEQVARHLVQPTMIEIGQRWAKNEITVGQEHFASNLIRQRLLAVLQAQPSLPITAPRLVAACPPAEQHELGLLLFALLARRSGWQVFYLGQRTPLADLRSWTDAVQLIVLTVSTVNGLASLIPLWNEADRPSATLVMGGFIFSQFPVLREHIPGAYLGDDAVEAVQTLATSEARVSRWMPAREDLHLAFTIEDRRLELADATMAAMGETRKAALLMARHQLVDPTLFLIDALASSLAFGAPEIMDQQGAWIGSLLTHHGVDPEMLRLHLGSFARAAKELLPASAARTITPLVERMLSGAGQNVN